MELASCLADLGVLHGLQGAYARAEPHLERALAIREKELGPHHPLVAATLGDLAAHYYTLGAYGRAQPLLERALAIHERALGLHHPLVAVDLGHLAALYRDKGMYEEAKALHMRALTIQEQALDPQHPDLAMTLANLATLYRDEGMYEEARALHQRALAIQEQALGLHHPIVATSLSRLALVYEDQGAFEEAEALHQRALAIFAKALGPDHPSMAMSLNNLAMLYHDQGRHDLALQLHRRALDIDESNLVRNLTVADETRRLAYASKLSESLHYTLSLHLQVASQHHGIAELALTTLLRRKNRVQDLVSQSNAALRRSLPEKDQHLLDDLADVGSRIAVMSSRGPGNITTETHAQRLDELRRQRDQLWNDLAEDSPLDDSPDHPVTIEEIQRALPVGRVLIEVAQYVPYHDDSGARVRTSEAELPPRYAAYLVFSDHFDWVDLGLAATIDEHVNALRHAIQTKQANPTELYDVVMRPIIAKLGSTRRLIIAPAGNLSLIPFGALHDGERYLVEQYDLRYVTTGRDLLDAPASPPVTTTPVTIVANPTGADLPDAELEADFLTSFFPETRVLLDDRATETNVHAIERPFILHMATHGFFGAARGERESSMFHSGLYLADVEQVEVDRKRDDGKLTADEVSGMDLRGTQLVVLSACDTGMGEVIESEGKPVMSEGISGLRRAFAIAGARATVTSLWGVSGVTTQKLMEAYYRELAKGLGRGEAMQAVQLELLHTEEHRHPKDWAAFIVSGDDTPLVFPPGQEPRLPEPEPEPPEPETSDGCTCKPTGRDAPADSMLVGLLGLARIRRPRRKPTHRATSARRLALALPLLAALFLILACRHTRPTAPSSNTKPTTVPEVIEWLLGTQLRGPKTRHRGDVGIVTYDLSHANARPTLLPHPETCAPDLVQFISVPTRSGARFAIDKAGHLLHHTDSGWSTVPSTKPLPAIGRLVAFSTPVTPAHLVLLVSLRSRDRELFLLTVQDDRVTAIEPVELDGFRERRGALLRWDSGRCVEGVHDCLHLMSADGILILMREPELFDDHEEIPVALDEDTLDVRYADAAGTKVDVLTPDACTAAASEPERSGQPEAAP